MKKILSLGISLLSIVTSFPQNSQPIGQSSNAYSMLRASQNQVFVNPALNVVGFIFRQNVALYGLPASDNGRLRFSISTDGGITWNTELGELNSIYSRAARFPQSLLYNPPANTDPNLAYIVWGGPTLPASFDGLVNGACQLTTSNPVTTTETYSFQNTSTYIPGGLTESVSGIFWMAENATINDTTFTDSINVYKGTFNAGNVNWVKHVALYAPHSTTYDGERHLTGPNMAFSNDGQIGYLVFMGDIGIADTSYNPIIYKSTDAGSTWSNAFELHVDSIVGTADSIKQYLISTGTNVESCTEIGTTFECDLTVDATNNLHIFTTICAVERTDTGGIITGEKQYTVWSAYPKNAVDIYSTDGGITWTSLYVAQINTFRTTIPSSPAPIGVDNFNQISRTADGNLIFYSWSDTDTIGHSGATSNEAPNTYVAGFNITNGTRTCWKQIRGVQNEEFAVSPSMAPLVLEGLNGGPEYTLPIVSQELTLDGVTATIYHYVGKAAKFCDEDFMNPVGLDLSWNGTPLPFCYNYDACFAAGIEDEVLIHFNIYPNPATEILHVQFEGSETIKNMSVLNNLGQLISTTNPQQSNNANEFLVNITGLSSGLYILQIRTAAKAYTKKFTVIR